MPYLSHYIEKQQTETFNKHGAFFAFSDKQFDEQKQPGVKYVAVGAGLIAPKDNAAQLLIDLDSITQKGIEQDLAENGVKAIIHRELANHECQITMDYSDIVGLLSDYGITESRIAAEFPEFMQYCRDNDYF